MLDGSTCKVSCPKGKFPDAQRVCQNCNATCATCAGDANSCLTCNSGDFLDESSCVNPCPDGKFPEGKDCRVCSTSCATCAISANNCTSCKADDVKDGNNCIKECPAGRFELERSCLACKKPCSACKGAADYCTECHESLNMVAHEGQCICPKGTYWGGETCMDCDKTCSTCGGAAQNCTSCHEYAMLQGSSCICPNDMFQAKDGTCVPCAPTCKTCAGNSSTCTSCHATQHRSLQDAQCVCPKGTFSSKSTSHVCTACSCPCSECSGSATNCQACYGIATLTPAGGGQTCSCPNSTFWIKAPEGEGGCGRCKACSTGGTCQTCDKSPRKCTSCIKSHFLLDDSCLKTCPNNHLAQDGRCQKLIGAVVSFSRSKQLLTAASCSDQSVACAVKGEVQGAQASPTQQWIIADGGDDTMVLRNFQDGSLMNVTSEGTLKHCWPDHGTAACSDMPGSVQFRSVVSEEGQLGLLSVSTSRYLILADLIDFSEEMSVKAAVPGGAWLHPTILVKQPFTAALRYYDHCDTPIQSELECKLAAAQQGVIRYSQFSPWNGDSSFPPYCFSLTETVKDLAVTRLVLNIKAGAAKRSYLRYQQCSKTTPCLCKS